MKTFGKKIAELMDATHLTQRQFAAKSGLSLDTIRRVRQMQKSEDCRPTTFQAIANGLEMSVDELHARLSNDSGLPEGYTHDPFRLPVEQRASWMPMLGHAAAGKPVDFELSAVGDRNVPGSLYHAPQEAPAIIVADGDSMTPQIHHGDLVIIARRFWRPPATGDIVAVSMVQQRGTTIKRLEILKDGRWRLIPRNPDHIDQTVEQADIQSSAVVVGWYHPVHHPRSPGKK